MHTSNSTSNLEGAGRRNGVASVGGFQGSVSSSNLNEATPPVVGRQTIGGGGNPFEDFDTFFEAAAAVAAKAGGFSNLPSKG